MRKKPKELVQESKDASMEVSLAKARGDATVWKAKCKGAIASAIATEKQLDVALSLEVETHRGFMDKLIPRVKKSKPEGVAVVVPDTDWHVEETVYKESTNGKNCFNLTEAEKRIKRFYQKIVKLIEWQNHLAPVVELWHPLLGDLISGYIHEELMESNSLSPTEACLFLQDMLCSGIDFLLKETKLPIFIPTCIGNHGRTTQRMHIKTGYKNSYEWLLYKTLANVYKKNKRVMWDVAQGYHNTQTIMGRKVRFHHGDGLRYMGGIGGITIPINKAIAQWNKVEAVDFDIFGHWHTHLINYPTWISCGSLMGYSEYSVSIKAEYQAPTQTFIVLDRRYGMTQAIPVFLTPARRK